MKLTKLALDKISDSKSLPGKLAIALKVSPSTMWRYLSTNDDELTKAASLKIIREELRLEDSEILEETETAKSEA